MFKQVKNLKFMIKIKSFKTSKLQKLQSRFSILNLKVTLVITVWIILNPVPGIRANMNNITGCLPTQLLFSKTDICKQTVNFTRSSLSNRVLDLLITDHLIRFAQFNNSSSLSSPQIVNSVPRIELPQRHDVPLGNVHNMCIIPLPSTIWGLIVIPEYGQFW